MKIELTKKQLENLKILLNKIIFQGGYEQVKAEIIALEEIAKILNSEQNGKEK